MMMTFWQIYRLDGQEGQRAKRVKGLRGLEGQEGQRSEGHKGQLGQLGQYLDLDPICIFTIFGFVANLRDLLSLF